MKRKRRRSVGLRRLRSPTRQTKTSKSVQARRRFKRQKRYFGSRKQAPTRKSKRRIARSKKVLRSIRRRRSRRRMVTFSNGQRHLVVLSRRMASENGRYLNAVRRLLHTNDPSALAEFVGQSIKDIRGHEFLLETRANALYRANAVPEPIAEIYQVIA